MRISFLLMIIPSALSQSCLEGYSFLEGIRNIIRQDNGISENDVRYKPFTGSFTNIHGESDPKLESVKYCITDKACGIMEAYSTPNIPLERLNCNIFCYIDSTTKKYSPSTMHTVYNPPDAYLSCGWETCS